MNVNVSDEGVINTDLQFGGLQKFHMSVKLLLKGYDTELVFGDTAVF